MPAILLPNGKQQFFTTPGVPAVGYKLATWAAGTTTPQTTWADALKVSTNPNPIILDARGEAVIFWDGAYKIQLQDATGAPVWPPIDNVNSIPAPSASLIPTVDNSFTLGSPAFSWANLYLGAGDAAAYDPITGNIGYIARTAAEIAASITPVNFTYPERDPRRYGGVGNGVTNDAAAVQFAFNVAGKAGGPVLFPAGFTFLCSSDISVPVATSVGAPVGGAQGPGWATISVIFGTGAVFGFIILGGGATTGDVQGSVYNYAGCFRDLGIQLNGTANSAFYINSVNQPRLENVWIRGSGTNGRSVFFLNCLCPLFKDSLVTGCGSATQYSVEFDNCTTSAWRGSRISGGVTTKGGLAIDRCTNFVIDGISSESCGTPIVIGGKAEAALACTGIIMRGLELENPGSLGQYILIGTGLSGSALVIDVMLDGMYGSPSGTVTVAYGVKLTNVSGFEAKGCHFTQGSAPTSCFEIANTNVSGVVIRPHRNLQSLGIPWVRYNGAQVLAAGPLVEWQLGLIQSGKPLAQSRGLMALYDAGATSTVTGATPSVLVDALMGGYFETLNFANGGAVTVISLSGGEPGMHIYCLATNANTTLTFGNSGGAFRTISGANLTMAAGKIYEFINDGSNGTGGSCWVQL